MTSSNGPLTYIKNLWIASKGDFSGVYINKLTTPTMDAMLGLVKVG